MTEQKAPMANPQHAQAGPQHAAPQQKPSAVAGFIHQVRKHPLFFDAIFVILVLIALVGIWYWQDLSGKIFIENAQISAPVISLAPMGMGPIDKFYVEVGDSVSSGQRLALVGDEVITAKTDGTIIWLKNTPGQISGPQDTLIQMIDPRQMRVVGRIQEDKGLKDVHTGQKVVFTVDAFGDKKYEGVVDSIGETARQGDIVFSISDMRQEQEFDVSVLFDTQAYPELKNGMSAKMWVYKN
jgi:multidrug resistance efflux pump